MHQGDILLTHNREVGVRTVDTMCRVTTIIEESEVGEIGNRGLAVPREALFMFRRRLRDVHMQRALEFLIRFSQSAAELLIR